MSGADGKGGTMVAPRLTMGTVAAVGESTSRSPRAAGREAAGAAIERLRRKPDFLLLFATTGYVQSELLAGVAELAGDTPLSGCSGEGVITQQGSDESSHAVVVMAIASDRVRFVPLLATDLAQRPRDCGKALAEQVRQRGNAAGKCLLLFPDGVSGNCTQLLAGLHEALPYPLVVVGGAAAGNIASIKKTYQYFEGRAVTDAVAAVLIGGDFVLETRLSHGSTPIGVVRTVTKSDGGTVYEIDGRRAWEVFKEYFDGDLTEATSADLIHMAFAEKLPAELAGPWGEYVMHTPVDYDPQSGALIFAGELRSGSKIRIARRDPDRIREGATEAAKDLAAAAGGERPSLVLQFDCAGRGRVVFGERATATTVSSVQNAIGPDVPWLGFYTYGEIAPLKGKTLYHNHTVVLCALYDGLEVPAEGQRWTSKS
jgi:hypothetical protein